MSRPVYDKESLAAFKPTQDAFIGIDSDGCVFDTMETKQKLCFHGLIIQFWNLEPIGAQVREVAEFVNLYSTWRGQNRFTALLKTFELLAGHPAVREQGFALPDTAPLAIWAASGVPLDHAHLAPAADEDSSSFLRNLLNWSLAVNEEIARKASDIPPFPWAKRSLARIADVADAACISQTPSEALVREWQHNHILDYLSFVAGPELGTKTEQLQAATNNKYTRGRILMIGDAVGDRMAAESCSAWFYPINPGHEDESWEQFHTRILDRFIEGSFDSELQAQLNSEFDRLLPSTPPWSPQESPPGTQTAKADS